jgi:hypothetical protein
MVLRELASKRNCLRLQTFLITGTPNISATESNMYNICVGVFCTDKNRVVKISRSSFKVVLWTTNHTMIYPGLGPSLEVTALRPVAWY